MVNLFNIRNVFMSYLLDRQYYIKLFLCSKCFFLKVILLCYLGEDTWLKLLEGHNKRKLLEEYKMSHGMIFTNQYLHLLYIFLLLTQIILIGGRLPPDSTIQVIGKLLFPCLYKKNTEYIKLGADLENKQRKESFRN